MKEIKEMEGIEGMLDDDGLQDELALSDNPENSNDEDTSPRSKPKENNSKKKESTQKGSKRKQNKPNFVVDDGNDSDEWILDHTGVRRKPFKVMHREIKDIIKNKIVIAHNLPKDFAYLRITRHD